MSKKFQVIVADPPWGNFKDSLKMSGVKRGASANYDTMTMQEISGLSVNDIADPSGCLLALWVPSSILPDGLAVMQAWGFAHKQTYVWVKTKKIPLADFIHLAKPKKVTPLNYKSYITILFDTMKHINMSSILAFGMGRLFRQTHEICLIGINNTGVYKQLKNKSQRSVSFATNMRHSAKPEDLQNSLELMFPTVSKIELFARRIRPGWTCLGNEICNGEDIRVSLSKL